MDVQIFYEGVDITSDVVSYDRDKSICTSVGAVQVVLKRTASVTPGVYKTITIHEGGHKKGTYFIHTIDKSIPENTMVLSAQDASLKLQDYFVDETYYIDYPSTSDYWINLILTDATVEYTYEGGATGGTLLSNNTSLGMAPAIDVVFPLLQQNGWYMSFDADNIAHIGKLSVDTTQYAATLTDDEILNIETTEHDKMFRNRAVVWGNGNPDTGKWIFADVDRHGTYANEYPGGKDVRAVVIANSNIKEKSAALSIASSAVREFSSTSYEIVVDVAGALDVDVGDYVFVNSSYISRSGLVTTVGSSMSDKGLITHLVLNQKCPRIFAYFDYGGYVYVGTAGAGVWRKPLKFSHVWQNFSQGLTDLGIVDLAIDNGAYACVTVGGSLFIRTDADAAWEQFAPMLTETFSGGGTVIYPVASGMATCCTFDKTTGATIAGFTLRTVGSSDPVKSWVYYINSKTNYIGYQFEDEEQERRYKIVALDNNGTQNLASVIANWTGELFLWNDDHHEGGYYYYNSEKLTLSGWQVTQISANHQTPMWADRKVCADGKYIYEMTSRSYWIGDQLYYTLTVTEMFTKTKAIVNTYTFDAGTHRVDAGFGQAVGNRCVMFPVEEDGEITFYLFNFKKLIEKEYHTLQYGYVIGTAVAIEGGRRRFYTLINIEGGQLKLIYYNVDNGVAFLIDANEAPLSLYEGTIIDVTYVEKSGIVTDDYLMFLVVADYEDCVIGQDEFGEDITAFLSLPMVLFNHLGIPLTYLNENVHSQMLSYGGFIALQNWDFYAMGPYEDNFYLGIGMDVDIGDGEIEYQNLIIRASHNGLSDTIILSSNTAQILSAFGNKTHLYFALSGIGVEIYDVNYRQVIKTFVTDDPNDVTIFSQMDEETDNFFMYRITTGDITSYSVYTSGFFTYPLNIFPNTHYSPVYGQFSYLDTHAFLIHDHFYLNVISWAAGAGVAFSEKLNLIGPSGAISILPADYTKWAVNDALIMIDHDDTYYTTVLDTAVPYNIECSSTAPFITFGNTVFSGLVISGEQTGWSQGQLYLSNTGYENSFSHVILDSLNSYISDARSFTAISGVGEDAAFGTYAIFPNPQDEMMDGIDITELVTLDVTNLPANGTAIISSGTLNTTANVVHEFEGFANHVETTNYQDVPYIFVSISGIPPAFWQKDARTIDEPETEFIDRTNNLPQSNITCIRCDDVI